ncbi:unnamed protein product [Pseudo-nitzschia multistriata]|uniref:Uncharacterized protein n=1 Tax=Pseudo-nitzschia multistriata TaxID=183589 RepID=A0A448Z098_9STRA|nr:unnamed protein product [Pseudo-nitzschia multistriata]
MSSSEPTKQEPNDSNKERPRSASSAWSFSSLFSSSSSFKDRFQEFDDKQRIERLSACQELDKILSDCRERHQQREDPSKLGINEDNGDHHLDPIESVSIGLRNMKYFGWRGILLQRKREANSPTDGNVEVQMVENNDDGPDLSAFHDKIRSSCAREQHAVWACRAVATGCGKDISELKRCFESVDIFDEDGIDNSSMEPARLPQHIRVLTTPYTNYEGIIEKVADSTDGNNNDVASLRNRIPCHDIQRRLGSCVTANGRALLERKQQRER